MMIRSPISTQMVAAARWIGGVPRNAATNAVAGSW
jgi:hypothetical protein